MVTRELPRWHFLSAVKRFANGNSVHGGSATGAHGYAISIAGAHGYAISIAVFMAVCHRNPWIRHIHSRFHNSRIQIIYVMGGFGI